MSAAIEPYMVAMRAIAREAVARGLTSNGDVVEDVAAWEINEPFMIDGREVRVVQRPNDGTIEVEWADTRTRFFVTPAQLAAGTRRPISEEGD